MPAKKATTRKAPSAKQLAARKRFALVAKARSKKAIKRNPLIASRSGFYELEYRPNDGPQVITLKRSKNLETVKEAQDKLPAEKRKRSYIMDSKGYVVGGSRFHSNPKSKRNPKAAESNPKVYRRKVNGEYHDLVIRGTAEKTAAGWQVGKRVFPQGKGTVKVASGYFLDRGTGLVFAKRKRNSDHRDADHPIPVVHHWRQGPPGYLTPWQRAHHAGQQGLFEHGITPAKLRAKKNAAKGKLSKRRNSDSSQAIADRKEFAGQFNGFENVYAAKGTPEGLSRCGILAAIILTDKSQLAFRQQNVLFLAQDTNHKLHILSAVPGPMVDNKPGNYGEIKTVEYIESKPHLGSSEKIQWIHKMGEVSGKRPSLIVDSNGQLRLKGGDYSINWRGIIN